MQTRGGTASPLACLGCVWLLYTYTTMSPLSTFFLALAMSTDAFAAAVGKGASMSRHRWSLALKAGLIFGCIEAMTPLLGWLLGKVAAPYVDAWDHWIAFLLLLGLGLHMVWRSLKSSGPDEPAEGTETAGHGATGMRTYLTLALTGMATSIDALAVGVGLAFIDADIFSTAAAIGLATMVMVTIGMMLGRVLRGVVGTRAELLGGVVLIVVGFGILSTHMG
ncbi:Putative Mn2+ efflux pump MntP [Lampropedia hyalina DSM 16112]|jgi:putative Mn2+ efflux pump MntP|uniref:Putative manganese efflux pump MntP n=2 Tax=Lampropedia TaxID=198705 RepID=A0A1M5EWT4_9BURK|nr:Putative Mn2+ efflux pump MntP [Lampropedia hyalina DSM 16112]